MLTWPLCPEASLPEVNLPALTQVFSSFCGAFVSGALLTSSNGFPMGIWAFWLVLDWVRVFFPKLSLVCTHLILSFPVSTCKPHFQEEKPCVFSWKTSISRSYCYVILLGTILKDGIRAVGWFWSKVRFTHEQGCLSQHLGCWMQAGGNSVGRRRQAVEGKEPGPASSEEARGAKGGLQVPWGGQGPAPGAWHHCLADPAQESTAVTRKLALAYPDQVPAPW